MTDLAPDLPRYRFEYNRRHWRALDEQLGKIADCVGFGNAKGRWGWDDEREYPPLSEIAAGAAEIRSEWSDRDERRRRVGRNNKRLAWCVESGKDAG